MLAGVPFEFIGTAYREKDFQGEANDVKSSCSSLTNAVGTEIANPKRGEQQQE